MNDYTVSTGDKFQSLRKEFFDSSLIGWAGFSANSQECGLEF